MYFKQILDERCGCASYLIASRQSLEAAIVDPSIEIAQYQPLLQERGFTLKYVIDTHVHADHVSGAQFTFVQFNKSRPLKSGTNRPSSDRPTSAAWRSEEQQSVMARIPDGFMPNKVERAHRESNDLRRVSLTESLSLGGNPFTTASALRIFCFADFQLERHKTHD